MAEKTKTRQKPKARSRGSTGKASKSPATKSRKAVGSTSRSRNRSKNGSRRIDTARHTVEETAKDAGQAVGDAMSKAKVPLVAGGAALAGAAGGAVIGARQARRHRVGAKALSRRPQVKVTSHDLAKVAKEVGSFGAQMGRLATELQQTREAAGNGRHRSPVEVVLDGLTARRSG